MGEREREKKKEGEINTSSPGLLASWLQWLEVSCSEARRQDPPVGLPSGCRGPALGSSSIASLGALEGSCNGNKAAGA